MKFYSFLLLCFCSVSFAESLENFMASKVVARAAWGAKAAKPDMTRNPQKRVIAIHHSAGVSHSDRATVKDIQTYHMDNRGWSDIGYHFLVAVNGTIYEGRELQYQGAHVYGHNAGSIGLNFLGCFDSVECHWPQYPAVASVTDAMIRSMGQLVGVLCAHYDIEVNDQNIKGHRQFSGAKTACPGDRILERLPEIRAIAQDVVSGKNNDEL
jgi:hypothetical protein